MLVMLAAALLGGMVVAARLPEGHVFVDAGGWLGVCCITIGTGLAAAAGRFSGSPLSTIVSGFLMIGAAFSAGLSIGPAAPAPTIPRGLSRITVRVTKTELDRERGRSTATVLSGRRLADGRPIPAGARLRIAASLPRGAKVRLLAKLSPQVAYRNLSPHPPWPQSRSIAGWARLPAGAQPKVLAESSLDQPLHRPLRHARRAVHTHLRQTLPPRAAGLAGALVLGDSSGLDRDDQDAVRGAGLAHVLAVSGLHIAMVASSFVWLIERALRHLPQVLDPARFAAALGIPFALVFAGFAGGAPSAWRAAITAALVWGLRLAGRRARPAPTAALAVILFSLVSPRNATRPAFLLSVLAVAAIVRLPSLQGFSEHESVFFSIKDAFIAWKHTTLATLPVALWCFSGVPLVGALANAVLLPIGTVAVVPLAIAHASTILVPTFLASIRDGSAWLYSTVAAGFVEASAELARSSWGLNLPPLSAAQGFILAMGSIGWLMGSSLRTRLWIVALVMVGIAACEWKLRVDEQPRDLLRVTMVDVGQGDSFLVDLPNGQLMLIDTGGGYPDPGQHAVLPLLKARRRSVVDVAVITHSHPDHYEGLNALRRDITIKELWDSGQTTAETPNGPLSQLLRDIRSQGTGPQKHETQIRLPRALCDRTRHFGKALVDVVWPCPEFDPGFAPNSNSLVIRVRFGAHRFLFTGDLEADAEGELLRRHVDVRSEVLKVGHHGSRTSSTRAFLRAIRPTLALISAGVGNRYGHPHADVLDNLSSARAHVVRTDREGGAIITSDGARLSVQTHASREKRRWHTTKAQNNGTQPAK